MAHYPEDVDVGRRSRGWQGWASRESRTSSGEEQERSHLLRNEKISS